MEWFGNKNPQLHKAGGTLAPFSNNIGELNILIQKMKKITAQTVLLFFTFRF